MQNKELYINAVCGCKIPYGYPMDKIKGLVNIAAGWNRDEISKLTTTEFETLYADIAAGWNRDEISKLTATELETLYNDVTNFAYEQEQTKPTVLDTPARKMRVEFCNDLVNDFCALNRFYGVY